MTDETDRPVLERCGWIDRSARVRIEVTGPDRAKFLHNLTTNDVKRLATGKGCEAFVTSLQGKTLGFVTIHALDDRILVRADAGALELLSPHFQKYGALDDVAWEDVSSRTFELHVAGPSSTDILGQLTSDALPDGDYALARTTIAGCSVLVIAERPTGTTGFTVIGDKADEAAVAEALRKAGESLGLVEIDPAMFEVLRIEAGTPVFGKDVTAENLPQEVGRDSLAINFVKGCYLGQETVARIDALGHVNKMLKGLTFDTSELPPPGTALSIDGKNVGTVTSSAFSPRRGCAVGLGYVRVAHGQPDTVLALDVGGHRQAATVHDLPMRGVS